MTKGKLNINGDIQKSIFNLFTLLGVTQDVCAAIISWDLEHPTIETVYKIDNLSAQIDDQTKTQIRELSSRIERCTRSKIIVG
jgi:hypothetical protein